MSSIPVRLTRRLVLQAPRCQVGPAVFVQRRRGGSRTAVDDGNVRFQWQRDDGSVGGDGDGR
jgi:hypothetical protein